MRDNRSCTCHPDEAPKPCQKRYALTDCQAARIEQLEAALREIAEVGYVSLKDAPAMHDEAIKIARAALEERT